MKKADSIIYGDIYTLDTDTPMVKAMAVRNGRIIYLGAREIADTMKGEGTEILDFTGCAVYPGMMDAHTHGPMAGERLVLQVPMKTGDTMQHYVDQMADYVRANPDIQVYKGAGWTILEKEPTAAMLDSVCPDKPMLLRSVDGHMLWLNSAAMKACGIDREYAKRFTTTEVRVDENGDPTGLFSEKPLYEILARYPVTKDEMKKALLAWQDFAFSQGITAVGEALLDLYPVCADAYAELVKEGKWKLRTYSYVSYSRRIRENPELAGELLKADAEKYNSEYFKIVGLKVILDGVVEAHTAAMFDEYADQPGDCGVLNIPDQEVLNRIFLSANGAGFPVHTHTIGDKAAAMALDACQSAETETCDFDIRNVLCHLQIIRPEDIRRCGAYNVVAVVAPLWVPVSHPGFDYTVSYLGEDRAWQQYPIKAFEDAGATICFHTDYPVSSLMSVPLSVYSAVKRCRPVSRGGCCGPRSVMNPDEGISPMRALLAMTANAAYMVHDERNIGTLAIGKVANATVYTRDFIHCEDPEDIMKSALVATVVDGRAVYRA